MQGFGGSEGMAAILKGLRCGMARARFATSAADTFFSPSRSDVWSSRALRVSAALASAKV